MQPEEIFHCIQKNLRTLQDKGLIENREIDDHDFFALAPLTLLQGKAHPKPGLHEGPDEVVSPKTESWSTELEAVSLTNETIGGPPDKGDVKSPSDLETWRNFPRYSLTYNDPNEFFEAMGFDDRELYSDARLDGLAGSDTMSAEKLGSQTLTLVERSVHVPSNNFEHISASVSNPLSTLNMSTSTGLPVTAPESTLDHFTFAFINYAHQLISTGTSLAELNNFGIPNCDLLFRDRSPKDKYSIPNWACEVRTSFLPFAE